MSPFLLQILSLLFFTGDSQTKIKLFQENVTDLFGLNDFNYPAQNLLDEQELAGDPLNDISHAGKCLTPWLPVYGSPWYPIDAPSFPGPIAAINLGVIYNISNICIFTQYGSWNMTWRVLENNPFQTDSTIEFTSIVHGGTWGNHWNCINFTSQQNVYGQFITLSLYNPPETSLLELVIYGKTKKNIIIKNDDTKNYKYNGNDTPLGMLMGTNAFMWTPINNLTDSVGAVREYQDWSFTEGGNNHNYPGYPNNENRFEYTTNFFFYDQVLGNATKYKLNWHQCLQVTPSWIHNWNESETNWKPINDSIYFKLNATIDPNSYIDVADHVWQVTARYGRQKVNDALLKLAPNISINDSTSQPRLSGTNLLEWIEVYNEPNCWWKDRNIFFSASEHAAMQSAAYDGHCSTMPNTVGIKQIDKTMNVSMGGLANQTLLDRFQTTLWWSQQFRKGNDCFKTFPADAINIHFYAGNNESTEGVSPEQYKVLQKIKHLTEWRDKFIPNVQFWVTEYGYDTNQKSKYHAPKIGNFSAEQVQGIWIMRTILSLSAANIQRAHQFMWADVNSESGQQYSTSGLVTHPTPYYQPKDSYWYFTAMYRALKNAYFVNRTCGNDDVCVQIYMIDNKKAFVIWCQTSIDKHINNYSLQVGGTSVLIITPIIGNVNGDQKNVSTTNGVIILNVSELPIFVLTS